MAIIPKAHGQSSEFLQTLLSHLFIKTHLSFPNKEWKKQVCND
jgi:hypothetical protein